MRHFHCPVNGWDCPYYMEETLIDGKKESCVCGMTFDKMNPYYECEDFLCGFWGRCRRKRLY